MTYGEGYIPREINNNGVDYTSIETLYGNISYLQEYKYNIKVNKEVQS